MGKLNLPQPIDYGLTYKETFHGLSVHGRFRDEVPECGLKNFTYKKGEWVPFWSASGILAALAVYCVGFAVIAECTTIPGGWLWGVAASYQSIFPLHTLPGQISASPAIRTNLLSQSWPCGTYSYHWTDGCFRYNRHSRVAGRLRG
jgi:hypothetical protein